jgi:hypothetical protein
MSARLTDSQALTLTSGAVLLGRFGHLLSEHEQELVAAAGRRFRDQGRDAMVTENEWPVILEAVGAMQAARADMERA